MSELSSIGKIKKAMRLAKLAHVGMELTYFDVIELSGEIESLKGYIAELEAELNNARELIGMTPAFPTWIPVSERLPEKDGYYLTYDKYAECSDMLFKHGEWFTPMPNQPIDPSNLTHWMPLPEPPEAK